MTELELLRELVESERARANAAQVALQHAHTEIVILRADAEVIRARRTRDANRKRNVRGHSTDILQTILGLSADPPSLTPPAPSPSLLPPTPPNNTSSPPPPPISPPTAAAAGAREAEPDIELPIPAEYRGDLDMLVARVPNPIAWKAEMRASLDGMHGPAVTAQQLGQAIRDFNANGAEPSLRHFRGYLRDVVRGPPPPRLHGAGNSNLAAVGYANARRGLGLDTT